MKRKEAILLVSEIRNYSDVCRKLPLPLLSDFADKWSGDVKRIVEENKGTLDKFIGDSVLAYWALSKSNIANAIGTAYDLFLMSNALNTMYPQLPEKVSVGVGINSGYVDIEDIGAKDIMLGSPVNSAFRLASLTKELKTNVMISYKLVRDIKKREYVKARGMEHEVAVCCYRFHELLELEKTLKGSGK